MHGGFYPGFDTTKPNFDLPVVYEDSHFAIVNKPPGIVCYSQQDDNHGVMTVRHALPFVLKPPKRGTCGIYMRPLAVHRLDKPTSGLLVIAKTKPAMVDLSQQFEDRQVKKTYTAIVNGIPSEPVESSITAEEAKKMGVEVDIGMNGDDESNWQLIDHALDNKSAITVWKQLDCSKSLKAKDNSLTLVELKPKTGRFHQLRRHMSLVRDCPLVGDTVSISTYFLARKFAFHVWDLCTYIGHIILSNHVMPTYISFDAFICFDSAFLRCKKYDGGGDAKKLRGRGLFLCSNKVVLNHPYYNTEDGRLEWNSLPDSEKWGNGMIRFSEDGTTLEVHASLDLPNKFHSFLAAERRRYDKFYEYRDNEIE